MLSRIDPTQTEAWKKLSAHAGTMKGLPLREFFSGDAQRFDKYSIRFGDILFDYSKNLFSGQTKEFLHQLGR